MTDTRQEVNDNQALDNVNVDTQDNQETTTQTSTESNVENNGTELSNVSNQQNDNEVALKRLEGKMSKLERETNQAKQEAEQHRQWVLQKEERTRDFLRDRGYDDRQIDEAINTIKRDYTDIASKWGGKKSEPDRSTASVPQMDYETARQIARQELMISKAQEEFFNAVPEMHPANVQKLSDEEAQARLILAESIEKYAYYKAKQNGLRLPTSQMYIEAYKLLRNPSGIGQAREEGEIAGIAKANAANLGTFSNAQSSGGATKSVNLSQDELEMAKKFGISPEEYAKYK